MAVKVAPAWTPATRNVVLARLISSTGVEGAFIIGLWGRAAFEFDGSAGELAVMSALVALAAMTGSIVGGSLVDRFGAKRVVVWSEILFVPATLSMLLAGDIWTLVALGTASWFLGAVFETAITSFPPLLADDAQLERVNARLESANWAALIVGPALAAPLAAVVGTGAVFVFDAVTSLIALALLARVHVGMPAARVADASESGAGGLAGVVDGIRYALVNPAIRLSLYLEGLVAVAFGTFIALEPLFFRDVVGVGIEAVGYVNAVFGVGLLIGSLALERAARRQLGFRWLIALTTVTGLGGMLYVVSSSLTVVVVGAVVWSIPLGASLPLSRALAQRHADPAYVGRTMGAFGTVGSASSLLPLAVAPTLAAAAGLQTVLVASAAVAVVGAPIMLARAAGLDRTSEAEVRPAEVAA